METLRQRLLEFYEADARDLPWRRTEDAYRIWITEIMLQQTQVATVRTRYEQFLERFPNVHVLASADVEAVCEEWAGLGYYSRARNLHAAATQLVARHDGRLPHDPAALRALPGIGAYTAGAIASIAYGVAVAAVDANAERVLCRLFAIDGAAVSARTKRVWAVATALVEGGEAGKLNQALMDVAAAYCRPARPRCGSCPLQSQCAAHRRGDPDRYPARRPKTPRRSMEVAMFWVQNGDGSVLIEQRPTEGLWAGQWQLPCEEGDDGAARLSARFGCRVVSCDVQVRHLLTHREVIAQVYKPLDFFERSLPRSQWVQVPRKARVNALSRKVIELMLQ